MEIKSKLLTGILSTILTKLIKSKIDTNIVLDINELRVYDLEDGGVGVHLDACGRINRKDLQKLVDNGLKNI